MCILALMLSLWKIQFLFLVIIALSSINASLHEPFDCTYRGREALFSGTVIAEERNPKYVKIFVQLHEVRLNNKTLACQIPVEFYTDTRDVLLGKRIVIQGRLVESKHTRKPMLLSGKLVGVCEQDSWHGAVIYQVRNYIEETLHALFQPEHSALSSGLVLGGSGRLYPTLKDVFTRAGVLHVFAVSGLHVGFVCAFVGALLIWVPISPKIKFAIIMLILCLYAGITGFRPSVCRATIMAFLFGLSLVLQRNVDAAHITTVSAIAFLVVSPIILFNLSAQLSFAAVYGIVLIYPVIKDKIIARVKGRFLKYILIPLGISFSAQACVWPLLVYYFHRLPTLAVLANLFIVPLASITIFLLFSMLIMNTFFALGAQVLAVVISVLLHVLTFISTVFARAPFAVLVLFISPVFLVLVYGLYARKTRPYALGLMLLVLCVWSVASLWNGVVVTAVPDAVLVTLPNTERVFVVLKKNLSAQHVLLKNHNNGEAEYVIACDRTFTPTKKYYQYPEELNKLHLHTNDITIACDETVRVMYQGQDIYANDGREDEHMTEVLYVLSDGEKQIHFTTPLYGSILDHIIRDLRVTLVKIQLLWGQI